MWCREGVHHLVIGDPHVVGEKQVLIGWFHGISTLINRGVMVIVGGYGHGGTSSNPGHD